MNRFIPLLAFLASAALGLQLVAHTRFPAPDELEHVSTVAALQESGRLLPRYDTQTSVEVDDWTRWSPRRNYIGHPPPYYLYLTPFLYRTQPPQQAVIPLRIASFALILLGLAAALARGWAAFGADRLALTIFCATVALCPELLSVARQVNNDALGFLGGALAYAAIVPRERRGWLDLAAGLGLMLALWAKPNAGLETGLFLGAFMLLRRSLPPRLLAALAGGGLVGVLPYAPILLTYGKLVPLAVEDLFEVRSLHGWGEYIPAFFGNVGATWGFMRTGVWPIPAIGLLTAAAFWAMVAGIPVATPAWRSNDGALAAAALLTFAAVLGIHLFFSGTRLHFSLPAPSFRYYLPLWPALAHALAAAVASSRPPWRAALATLCAVTLALGWLP